MVKQQLRFDKLPLVNRQVATAFRQAQRPKSKIQNPTFKISMSTHKLIYNYTFFAQQLG